jgi:HEPN domain-containing protein
LKKFFAYEILLKKANADLRTAKKLMNDVQVDVDIVCFHLQQFIENI